MLTISILVLSILLPCAHAQTTHQQGVHPSPTAARPQQTIHRLQTSALDINPHALELGVKAYFHAEAHHELQQPILTIIDYSRRSNQKRMWVFDMANHKLLHQTYVSHGQGSGGTYALRFSNRNGSHQSSLGVFISGDIYHGRNGISLRLYGKDRGYNDHALQRGLVVHGAWYTSPAFIQQHGYAGRSWGCPAIPTTLTKTILRKIQQGSLLLAYYPNPDWIRHSSYLS